MLQTVEPSTDLLRIRYITYRRSHSFETFYCSPNSLPVSSLSCPDIKNMATLISTSNGTLCIRASAPKRSACATCNVVRGGSQILASTSRPIYTPSAQSPTQMTSAWASCNQRSCRQPLSCRQGTNAQACHAGHLNRCRATVLTVAQRLHVSEG